MAVIIRSVTVSQFSDILIGCNSALIRIRLHPDPVRWTSGSGRIQSLWIWLRSGSGQILKYGTRCTSTADPNFTRSTPRGSSQISGGMGIIVVDNMSHFIKCWNPVNKLAFSWRCTSWRCVLWATNYANSTASGSHRSKQSLALLCDTTHWLLQCCLCDVTDRLQRVMSCECCHGLKTILYDELHWLNVHERIEYKLGVMVYRCLHDQAPRYLTDPLIPASDAAPRRLCLRSANLNRLTVPHCRLSTYGCPAFYHAGPTVWNSLPDGLRNSDGFDGFKRFWKTIPFHRN